MTEPLHVLELGDGVASSYAARLLADHGAEVIKLEPPGGDKLRRRGPFPDNQPHPEKSGLFLALNLNKRGIELDPASDQASLDRLLNWADILVYNLRPTAAQELGIDAFTLVESHPQLITLSITPFGTRGLYSNYAAEELTVTNAGGWASQCPATHTDPALPPLKVFGHQCALMSGIAGAMTALALAYERRRSGMGEFIDLAEQDYVASVLEVGIPAYSYSGNLVVRHGLRTLVPWRTFQAKDAAVFIVCIEQDQWERLVEFMGNPDWAQVELFADQPGRAENQDMVHSLVQEFVGQWEAEALYHEAQKKRICVAPVLSLAQLATNKHLRAREFFTQVDHEIVGVLDYPASAIVTNGGRAPFRRPAPKLGEHTNEVQNASLPSAAALPSPAHTRIAVDTPQAMAPLAGIRVLDLAWVWAGSFASMQLAHLGAEVIRLESSVRPDLYRRLPVHPPGMEDGLNRSGMFNQWNQGKHSVAVDLSKPAGIALVKQFVREADVVVQNFATGVLERLGLGYEALREENKKIILASISGCGQTGPYKDYMGYGPAIPPLTGLSAVTGYVGGGPEELGISMPDPTAGITAALGVVQALEQRERTGEGDHLDVSLWEATGALSIDAWMDYALNKEQPERMGNRDPQMSPHGCFACAGVDQWVSIACASDEQWRSFAELMATEMGTDIAGTDIANHERYTTLSARKTNEEALEALVSAWTLEQDRWEVTHKLQTLGIAAMPTLTCEDIVNDAHLNARGFIERLDHPEVGARAHSGIPWRLHNRPNGVQRPAPCLGADTDKLLSQVLGLSEPAIQQLKDADVLR